MDAGSRRPVGSGVTRSRAVGIRRAPRTGHGEFQSGCARWAVPRRRRPGRTPQTQRAKSHDNGAARPNASAQRLWFRQVNFGQSGSSLRRRDRGNAGIVRRFGTRDGRRGLSPIRPWDVSDGFGLAAVLFPADGSGPNRDGSKNGAEQSRRLSGELPGPSGLGGRGIRPTGCPRPRAWIAVHDRACTRREHPARVSRLARMPRLITGTGTNRDRVGMTPFG